MRKKYIQPSIELVSGFLCTSILAGSSGDGDTDLNGDKDNIGTDGPTETGAKYNQFSTWEDWDEY